MDFMHLKCDPPGPIADEDDLSFWDKAMACSSYSLWDCLAGGVEGAGECTWCESQHGEPDISFCVSQAFWDQLKGTQSARKQGNYVHVDQVFKCSSGIHNADIRVTSLFDTVCSQRGGSIIQTSDEEQKCLNTLDKDEVNCTISTNPFPGFMGSTAEKHCVNVNQQEIMLWTIDLLKEMGWKMETKW
jgi:hypothetical protein